MINISKRKGIRLWRRFLTSPLVSELPDGFGGNANLVAKCVAFATRFASTCAAAKKERMTSVIRSFLKKDYKKDIFSFCNKVSNPSKINAFRPSGEKLHQHFFTIHYYLLLAKKRQEVLVKSEK